VTVVSAVVVAYGESPWLGACVDALTASTDVDVEVVVVDNGSPVAAGLADRNGVEVVRPTDNLGFAGGCNFGVAHARGDVVALVNPDAIVEPAALARLASVAAVPSTGIATASLRLANAPDQLNSAGNEVHFLGFGWVGAFGEPADSRPAGQVTAASGAAMAMRRSVWDRVGGFDDEFFMYHEDADLSLRCWQVGLDVRYVPDAVVLHHYEFGRHASKLGLLERNRLVLVLTLYERRTLLLLGPALAAAELGMFGLALVQGWFGEKVKGWAWVVRNRAWLRDRRRRVQVARVVRDRDLAGLLARRLDAGNYRLPGIVRPVELLLAWYWAAVRRLL
jgi:GT2 family glycosyltransferase